MKKIKISIAVVSLIIIIILIMLSILNMNKSKENFNDTYNEISNKVLQTDSGTGEEEQNTSMASYLETDTLDYMNIEKCISSFLSVANRNNTAYFGSGGNKTTNDEEINNMILSLLSTNYIKKNNIDENNINSHIYNINEATFYIPTKVKKFYGDSQVNSFVVEGLIESQNYENIMTSYLILNTDIQNNTFSVEILDTKQDIESITPTKLRSIEKNSINEFENSISTDQEIIKEIVKLYKRTILGYPEIFYNNYLNKEYSNKKFADFSDFQSYLKKNKSWLQQINVEQYKVIKDNNEILYSLIDQYGNTFIIEYYSIIDYKVYLDSYTIELNAFKKEYNEANDDEKIAIQIEKFKQMINSGDYTAIYSKLNETFKNNNFTKISDLEKYINNSVYEQNSIVIGKVQEKEGYYACEGTLINQKDTDKWKNITIIIKLIDFSNFEMSFSINT